MNRICLIFKRADGQEDASRALLGRQQDKSSTTYHRWLPRAQLGKQFDRGSTNLQSAMPGFKVSGTAGHWTKP
jgi:hypothetical protein